MTLRDEAEQNGYAIRHSVVPVGEVVRLLEKLESNPLPRTRAGARHALQQTDVARFAADPPLLDLAREVLGPDAFPFRATFFDKSPDANWLVVWHQDTALPLMERQDVPGWGPWSVKAGVTYAHAPANALERVIALRLHLDDSTTQNGPLRVLPATHRSGVLTDAEIADAASRIAAVECVGGVGSVVAMRPLLLHSSSKSVSASPRRVLHIEYAASAELGEHLKLNVA